MVAGPFAGAEAGSDMMREAVIDGPPGYPSTITWSISFHDLRTVGDQESRALSGFSEGAGESTGDSAGDAPVVPGGSLRGTLHVSSERSHPSGACSGQEAVTADSRSHAWIDSEDAN